MADYYDLESKSFSGVGHGHQDDIVIVVMGSTGTGKSSFIKLLSGNTDIKIGNTLESETSRVNVVRFLDRLSGRNVSIVDTPGFDDSRVGVSDTDTLRSITNFLLDEYDKGRKLNGLVYLQRISDPRFSGQSGRNLRMFQGLCGAAAFKNVVVLTTFWDQVSTSEGVRREAQLKSNFLKDLVTGGARFMRHDHTIESTPQVLRHISTLAPTITQIQRDIREEGNSLEDTAAGSVLREEVEVIIAKYREKVADLKAEMGMIINSSQAMQRELGEERAKLQQEIARWDRERSELKKGLGEAKESREQLEAETSELQAQLVGLNTRRKTERTAPKEINAMDSPPPPYEDGRSSRAIFFSSTREQFQFLHSDKYPPYLKKIPSKHQTGSIFNFSALLETTAMLSFRPGTVPRIREMAPKSVTTHSMEDLVNRNHELHTKSKQNSRIRDMYLTENIGHRDDWYTDAAFGQQQFIGTNPTTITLAPLQWITAFKAASGTQQRVDVTRLLTDYPQSFFVQDYSDFRPSMGLSPSAEITSEGRYGCSSVALFHLEPSGKLHPLAITLDYKGGMENSVTIFNRRIASTSPGDEELDWPWRYAKMCAQVSDWFRHEVAIHLVNTHLVEEIIIIAANRTFEPRHIVFQLLEPHWNTTLPLNKAAREVLVPKIIIGMTGFTATQTYAFIKDAYNRFQWTDSYVPNDLRRRGFPIEDLDKVKYHNYGYARNIARMWEILRSFVCMVLTESYASGDAEVVNDRFIPAFCHEVRSHGQGQLASFPDIKTLDELIDFVTMCIHIASPQHTAVNYLQQYYQTFVPNKPSALYTRLPQSLAELQSFGEKDILSALPVHEPRDWLLMAQVPYLLSFEVPDDSNILHYATTISDSSSTPKVIRDAAMVLKDDLEDFVGTVAMYSQELDDQQTPYLVLDPSKTAISILI